MAASQEGPVVKRRSNLIMMFAIDTSLLASLSMCVQDLATLGLRHGMSTVHLRLAFARGLHPFYPPSLEASPFQG